MTLGGGFAGGGGRLRGAGGSVARGTGGGDALGGRGALLGSQGIGKCALARSIFKLGFLPEPVCPTPTFLDPLFLLHQSDVPVLLTPKLAVPWFPTPKLVTRRCRARYCRPCPACIWTRWRARTRRRSGIGRKATSSGSCSAGPQLRQRLPRCPGLRTGVYQPWRIPETCMQHPSPEISEMTHSVELPRQIKLTCRTIVET